MASREVLSFRPATASVDRALHKGRCVPASLSQAEPLRLTQLPIGAPRMRQVAWCWQQLAPVATWPRSLQQQGPFWKLPACAPPHAPPQHQLPSGEQRKSSSNLAALGVPTSTGMPGSCLLWVLDTPAWHWSRPLGTA